MVWVDNARILGIFGVIIIHVSAGVTLAIPPSQTLTGSIAHFYNALARYAVPVMVIISGVLLIRPEKTRNVGQFYRRRARKIVIPVVFWTLFYALWPDKSLIRNFILTGHWVYQGKDAAAIALEWARRIGTGKVCYHMWFLYMVPGFYLVAPFLTRALPAFSRRERILLLFLLFFLGSASQESSSVLLSFLPFLGYFAAGYLIDKGEIGMKTDHALLLFMAAGLLNAFSMLFLKSFTGETRNYYFFSAISPTTIAMGLAVVFIAKNLNFPFLGAFLTRRLSELSFGVFLVHPAMLEVLPRFGLHLGITHTAISVPLISVFVYLSSAAVTAVIQSLPLMRFTIPPDPRQYRQDASSRAGACGKERMALHQGSP